MGKRVIFILFLIIGVYLIVVLARDLWQVLGAGRRVSGAEQRVAELELEQQRLKEELAQAEKPGFIEKEARDKLLMGREGEVVVLLPQVEQVAPFDKTQGKQVAQVEQEKEDKLENWEKWLKLFIY